MFGMRSRDLASHDRKSTMVVVVSRIVVMVVGLVVGFVIGIGIARAAADSGFVRKVGGRCKDHGETSKEQQDETIVPAQFDVGGQFGASAKPMGLRGFGQFHPGGSVSRKELLLR